MWGYMTSLDLYDCDKLAITSQKNIKSYVQELVQKIDMVPYGDTVILCFGKEKTEGFSFSQFIETSLISGHFANASRQTFIDVFSCKPYDPNVIIQLSLSYFKGDIHNICTYVRGRKC